MHGWGSLSVRLSDSHTGDLASMGVLHRRGMDLCASELYRHCACMWLPSEQIMQMTGVQASHAYS